MLLNVGGKGISGHADAFVAHDAAEGDNSDFGAAAAYVDNHVALRGFNIEADAKSSCHRLINHIYIAAAGVLAGVAHGTNLHLGAARRNADHHAKRRGKPAAT